MDGAKSRELISYLPALARGGQNDCGFGEDAQALVGEECTAIVETGGREGGDSRVDAPQATDPGEEGAAKDWSPPLQPLTLPFRYWCPACSQEFVKWPQSRQRIYSTCRKNVIGVDGSIDDDALQNRCKNRSKVAEAREYQ